MAALIAELPEGVVVTDPDILESYRQDRAADPSAGTPLAVVRPHRTDEDAIATVERAWDLGIRTFDVAPLYGFGAAERRMGAALAGRPRDEFVLSTKVGRLLRPSPDTADQLDDAHLFAVPAELRRVWDFTADGVRRSLDESLGRLGLDAVDILFLHDPEEDNLGPALANGVPALGSAARSCR